jgi:hypothetical protein
VNFALSVLGWGKRSKGLKHMIWDSGFMIESLRFVVDGSELRTHLVERESAKSKPGFISAEK